MLRLPFLLYDAGALVALDDYIDKYPNIKEFLTDEEWDKLRQDDGHIYWINQFGNIYGEEKATTHSDEAFSGTLIFTIKPSLKNTLKLPLIRNPILPMRINPSMMQGF